MTRWATGERQGRRPLTVGLFVDANGLMTVDGRTQRWSDIVPTGSPQPGCIPRACATCT
jgi:hypothetical protein